MDDGKSRCRNSRCAILALSWWMQLLWCSHGIAAQDMDTKTLPFTSIALIRIEEPRRLTIENRGGPLQALGPIGHAAQSAMSSNNSDEFTAKIRAQGLNVGQDMTSALADELRKAGFSVDIIENVKYMPNDLDDIDYRSIKTDAQVLVNAEFDDAGLYAGNFSTYYKPRLNLDVDVINTTDLEEINSLSIHYGVDADESPEEDIPADPGYAYETFEKVIEKTGEIAECYRIGISKIAALVARQINQPERD